MLPWKQFWHVTDYSIQKEMDDVCCMLSRYGGLNIMSYHLLDMFHRYPHDSKEIIFLLNEILCGGMKCLLFHTLLFRIYLSYTEGQVKNKWKKEMYFIFPTF